MLYEYNGQTIPIPDEVYFKLTDSELLDYLASARGFNTENPFFDSILEEGDIIISEDFELPKDPEELDIEKEEE